MWYMLKTTDNVQQSRLAVIAPGEFGESLQNGLAHTCADLVLIPRRPPVPRPGDDPYGIGETAQNLFPRPDGILLIAPRRRAPGRLLPAPVLHGIPIGLVQADRAEQLGPWLQAVAVRRRDNSESRWATMAMNKELYLQWGRRFAGWLKTGAAGRQVRVVSWLADMVPRDKLCKLLATGPCLAVYSGHGRARGWSGYRALRWHHITAVKPERPCGTIFGLACDTLKRTRGIVPFGCRWVEEGRACAYVGSVARLGIKANEALARILGEILARGRCRTVGQLLSAVDNCLTQRSELSDARRALATYRLIGHPLQELY